ncbi:hypothetical protein F5148DRAFT_1305205 [Russula earlei]|uniref:Uncharacterized protein n=1 Tax=Russula earlei TaxID=71964 RepID=A0ACC0UKJ6_9AGAM|nr:hypothetical protein F5148DRAFT_1305205 [Russula earlei]
MASKILKDIAQFLTPAPPAFDTEYDGLEYTWKFLVFRPALFKYEVFFLAIVLSYLAFYWIGSKMNHNKAKTWLDAHMGILEKQFSRPTAGSSGDLTADGYTDFFAFSTGRRVVSSLHTVFTLRPRHDFFQFAYQLAWGLVDLLYTPRDDVTLDFKLHANVAVPEFVWAVVTKEEANSIKKDRWDLTFTKTTENPRLPPSLVIMSEFADVTENVLKIAGPVLEALRDHKILPHFRSLSITDQPRVRPSVISADRGEKHVILSLTAPPSSRAADSAQLVSAVFGLIDSLEKVTLRTETKSKLKKAREIFAKTLKDEAERDAREEAADAKLAAKRRAEEERIARLSAAEQQKLLERDRKRNLRKTQGKIVKK